MREHSGILERNPLLLRLIVSTFAQLATLINLSIAPAPPFLQRCYAGLLFSCNRRASSTASSESYSSPSDYIEKYVPKGARKIIGSGSRDNFNGDGRLWEIYELSSDDGDAFTKSLEDSDKWKSLPLSEDLRKLSFAYHAELPYESKEGFYFFYDFQPEWYPDYASNSKPVWDRSSVNFVIMIYIPSERRIYVDNLDT